MSSRRSLHSVTVPKNTKKPYTSTPPSRPIRWRVNIHQRSRRATIVFAIAVVIFSATAIAGWLAHRAQTIKVEMTAAAVLLPQFEGQVGENDKLAAKNTLEQIRQHASAARAAATDPLWVAVSATPWIGQNFSAVTVLASSATDLADGAAVPVLNTLGTLSTESLTPVEGKFDLSSLSAASPSIVSASNTVELTYERLATIDKSSLVSEVAEPLERATLALNEVRKKLTTAADASQVVPSMLGADEPRNYLVLVQNNAEVRATGGLAGALAVLSVREGRVELSAQSSGSALGAFSPKVAVDPAQTLIYSTRLGTYIGDINLTPDFPTVAKSAKAMWETRHVGTIDGVIALDPVVLAHILDASGPLGLTENQIIPPGMPMTLTSENVVRTLLSDVYTHIEADDEQDAYFAVTSQKIFESLAAGDAPGGELLAALSKSVDEGRIRIWSNDRDEQKLLGKLPISGAISGPAVGGTAFGVYFNDGTGAKMDYYVQRKVRLVKTCTSQEYAQFKVQVQLTNTAPADAASSLPKVVTGDGAHGVPAGSVQTNVVIYGPSMSHVDTALQDGTQVSFGSYIHENRPVGVLTTRLDPGQVTEVEMSFVKVIQGTDPKLVVTPTVQDVKDVLEPVEYAQCN